MRHVQRSYSRYLYRYGTVAVPVSALGVTIVGILFLVTDQGYDSPPYRFVFGTISRPMWGALFLLSGLAALAVVSWVTTLPLMITTGMWASMWVSAAADGLVPLHAPIPWAIVSLTLTAAVARRGLRG